VYIEVYNIEEYSSSNNFMQDVDNVIPLQIFFCLIWKNKKTLIDKWKTKYIALSHAVCDRSFLSPILLGVGSFLYRKFGSKNLISILSALNSYRRTVKL